MAKIYLIYNVINNKKYVGQTTNCVAQRFCQHIDQAFRKNKKTTNTNEFFKDIVNSGEKVFEIFKTKILCECDDNEKNIKELEYIQKIKPEYNTMHKNVCLLNISKKIIEEYKSGKTITELRIKYKCKHNFISNLLKINGIKIQKSRSKNGKKIYLFDKDGNVIKSWVNSGHCSNELGIDGGNIRLCCLKNTNENILYFSANGYHFKYNKETPKDMYRIIDKYGNEERFKTKESFIDFFKNKFPNKNILYGQLVRDRKTVYGYKIEKLFNHRN